MPNIWTLSLEGNKASAHQTAALATAMADVLKPKLGQSHIDPISLPVPADAPRIGTHTVVIKKSLIDRNNIWNYFLKHHTKKLDIVIAARAETGHTALKLKRLTSAKIVQIQNPNIKGAYNYDLRNFDVIVSQPQETITGDNIVPSGFTLHGVTPNLLADWREANTCACLHNHGIGSANPKLVAVMVGGSDENLAWNDAAFVNLGNRIGAMARNNPKTPIIVLTSRRTGEHGADILKDRLTHRNVLVNEPASFESVLSRATHFVATGDSFMMLNQIKATGQPCYIDTLGDKLLRHPMYPVLEKLERSGHIEWWLPPRPIPERSSQRPVNDNDTDLARAVCQKLGLV